MFVFCQSVCMSVCYSIYQQELSSCWDRRPFGHNRHGPKSVWGAAVPLSVGGGGGAGSPSNTVSPRPRSIQVPIVWPQYTNVTDRQTGHRSVAYSEPLLVTVAQKLHVQTSRDFLVASSDDNAVSYVLSVLFMTSCCPIISQTKVTPIWRYTQTDSPGGRIGGEVWRIWLPCYFLGKSDDFKPYGTTMHPDDPKPEVADLRPAAGSDSISLLRITRVNVPSSYRLHFIAYQLCSVADCQIRRYCANHLKSWKTRMWAYAQRDCRPRNIGGVLCWKWWGAKVP